MDLVDASSNCFVDWRCMEFLLVFRNVCFSSVLICAIYCSLSLSFSVTCVIIIIHSWTCAHCS